MTWFGWVAIAITALGALVNVARVGQDREPISGGEAAMVVFLDGLMILGLLLVGTGKL